MNSNWIDKMKKVNEDNSLVTTTYLKLVYQWSIFFKKDQLCQIIQFIYLSPKIQQSTCDLTMQQNCYLLNLICSKNMYDII